MILGEIIFSDQTAGTKYYTPWLPRGGNLAAITLMLSLASNAVASFTVQVQTKNQEDGDDLATDLLGTPQSVSLTAGAFTKFNVGENLDSSSQGFKDLYRFEYVLSAETANVLALAHFRMLEPSWLTN